MHFTTKRPGTDLQSVLFISADGKKRQVKLISNASAYLLKKDTAYFTQVHRLPGGTTQLVARLKSAADHQRDEEKVRQAWLDKVYGRTR